MKKLFLLAIMGLTFSCSASNQSSTFLEESELFVTRKYIGNYIDYRHTGIDTFSGIGLIWIKTSMENTYGKISAYGKKCEFTVGDRLYLTRKYFSPGGISAYWIYNIENDSTVYYRVTDFQNDHKLLVKDLF